MSGPVMIGRTVAHYQIESQLGAGGMGVVYRAVDTRLGRSVALKFVSEHLTHDREAINRLRAEARATSALNHPNICTIYDIGETDGHPFIVMELLKGRSLRQCLDEGALKPSMLVDLGIEIADALQAAHAEGIVHRDITPRNIFITERGHAKVLDFGLAKLTAAATDLALTVEATHRTGDGLALGTVAYMSPEQASGEPLDNRTDLFSTGVVLYESATGRHPFPGKTAPVVLAAILDSAPVAPIVINPSLPLRLQEVINNCLEKDRELRYQSAGDLRADLKRVRRDIESGASPIVARSAATVAVSNSVVARSTTPPPPPAGTPTASQSGSEAVPSKRRPALLAGIAALGIALAAIGGYSLATFAGRTNDSRDTAPAASPAATQTTDGSIAPREAPAAPREVPPAAGPAQTIPPAAPAQARTAPGRGPASAPAAPVTVETPAPRTSAPPVATPSPSTSAATTSVTPPAAQMTPAPVPATPAATQPPLSQPVAEAERQARAPETNEADRARPTAPPAAATPTADDEGAIRRLVATYARAIETKDLALFRSIKPNLSAEEQRRLENGFRAVTSQQVSLTIVSIDRRRDDASVVIKRRDTIDAGGRRQTVDSDQTLQLTRTAGGWVVVTIR
jgi:serine/threonine protein kinase